MSSALREFVGNHVRRPNRRRISIEARRLRLEPLERRLVLAAPVALDDGYDAFHAETLDVPAASGVLNNDSDADGDATWAELLTGPAHGTLDFQPDGSFTYDADGDYLGPDTFTYKALSEQQSAELVFDIDQGASSVTINATLNTSFGSPSASDTTPVAGTITARVTPPQSPFEIAHVTDMDVVAVDAMELRFSFAGYPFIGPRLTVRTLPGGDAAALHVLMETPGPAATVVGGLFSQLDNDVRVTGTASLSCESGGVVQCDGLGLPPTLDLNNVIEDVDLTDAQIVQGGSVITLTVPLDITQQLDDGTGNIVDMHFQGTIVANADAPAVGGIEESAAATVTIDVHPEERVVAGDDYYRLGEDTPISVPATAPVVEDLIVPAGSIWRYLDDGSDQTTLWRAADFDDAAWLQGPAQLGYSTGDPPEGDEVTPVEFGGDEANKFITTYFRREFSLLDPATVEALNVGLLRDDAAAVYLNGVEIVRDTALPAGAAFDTPASTSTGVPDESTFFAHSVDLSTLPAGTLVAGRNVLAVEVHQSGPTSSDLSFDFTLAAVRHAGGLLQNDAHRLGGSIEPFLLTDPQHGQLQLRPDGRFDFDPDAEFSGSDSFDYVAAETGTMLVAPGATWRYLDDGSDQQAAWRDFEFDDGSWSEGPAELGYGDGDERTAVEFGPASDDKHVTTYFRHSFDVAGGAALGPLMAYAIRDDGIAVYLNGTEIGRDNLPDDALFDTPADDAISNEAERLPVAFAVPAGILRDGRNDLAVEIHQSGPTSSDISFEMWMAAAPVSNVATVDLLVEPRDDVPVAEDDGPYQATVGVALAVPAAGGLLANDSDVESDTLTVFDYSDPHNGDVTVNPNGSFTYEGQFPGADSFTYRVAEPAAPLVDFGSAWRYLDDGSDQGSAWRERIFDDSAWAVGLGQLGYGDGDEATVVRYGPDAAAKHIVTYFRHDFFVESAANVADLTLELIRDDGAAVYLNGVRIALDNLDPDSPFYPLAGSAAGDGIPPLSLPVPEEGRLVNGWNVLAVEIHQDGPDSSDISFDARLTGRVVSDEAIVELESEDQDARMAGRFVFYHDSAFDVGGRDVNPAIATDKAALLPGGTATFANVTSYGPGINGIAIDIENLSSTPSASAFLFAVSDPSDPSGWSAINRQTVSFTRGGGVDDSDRLVFTFADHAVLNRWLRVTVLANASTGLSEDDVYYFGNAVGEVTPGGGLSTPPYTPLVNAADVVAVRDNPRGDANPAAIDDPHDINRDMRVDALDLVLARNGAASPLAALPRIAPVAPAPLGEAERGIAKDRSDRKSSATGTKTYRDDAVAAESATDPRWWKRL